MDKKRTNPTEDTYTTLQHAYQFFNQALFDSTLPDVIFTYSRQSRIMGYASIARWVNHQSEKIDEIAINPEYFAKHPLIEICQTLCHEMVHIWQAHFGKPSRRGYHNKEWAKKMESIGLVPSTTGKPGGDKTGENMMDYAMLFGPFHRTCIDLIASGYQLPWVDRYPIFRVEGPVLIYDQRGDAHELDKRYQPIATKTASQAKKMAHQEAFGASMASGDAMHFETYPDDAIDEQNWGLLDQYDDDNLSELISTKPLQKSGRVKYVCRCCHVQVWGKPKLNIGCLDCQRPMEEHL